VKYSHDISQAKNYADRALKRLAREEMPSTPDLFELWYVYYSGQSPELSRALDILVSSKQGLSTERCREIYEKFLGTSQKEELVRRTGSQVHETIRDVTGLVRNVKTATSEYKGKLGSFSGQVEKVEDPGVLKEILETVMIDTDTMISQNQQLEEQLNQSAHVMEKMQHDLEAVRKEAMTDGLTGLANRKAFDSELNRAIEESDAEHRIFSLLMLDIDHFKSFNDNFGHQIGDQVLRLVAKTLVDGVKGRDLASRYGGEEFAIILPDTPLSAGVIVGNALRKAVAVKDVVNRNTGEKLGNITMSVGVAEYYEGENPQDLIERSDSALYTAKHNGRNQVAAAPTPSAKKSRKKSVKTQKAG
jgi:diguanylate cyclase